MNKHAGGSSYTWPKPSLLRKKTASQLTGQACMVQSRAAARTQATDKAMVPAGSWFQHLAVLTLKCD